jgi:hypothetical protein
VQEIIDHIGCQHDQLTQLYFTEKLFKTEENKYQMFDYKYIEFSQLLDSMLVMNEVKHPALPILFPDQTVLIEIN